MKNSPQSLVHSPQLRKQEVRSFHLLLRGMTLTELLIGSTLMFVIILAIGHVDVTRVRLTQQVRQTGLSQSEVGLALAHMAKQLQQADRIKRLSASSVQFRVPLGIVFFDTASNYRWKQYRHDSGAKEIRFYDPACTLAFTFRDIGSLTVQYKGESPPPPGGDPPVQDNNVLELIVSSTGTPPMTYQGEVTIRAGAYTNLSATASGDSGCGLAPCGVSDPPGSC